VIPFDGYQAMGLVIRAIGEQNDISFSKVLGRNWHDVEEFSVLDRWLHASAAGLKPHAEALGKQTPREDAKELRMCSIFTH
jgi:hypothetical protein